MSGIILFMGKYGSTHQYAHWLAEDTGFDMIDLYSSPKFQLPNVAQVILGTSVHCGRLRIGGWMHHHWSWLRHREVYLYSVSGLSPESLLLKRLVQVHLGLHMLAHIHFFPLPGRLITSELDSLDRWLLKRETDFGIHLGKYPGQQRGSGGDFNHVSRKHLKPMLQQILRPGLS